MLSDGNFKEEISRPSKHEADLKKLTRISEIRKGADFTKTVNQLADHQWRSTSVMPRVVETEREGSPVKHPSQSHHEKPTLLQMSREQPPSTPLRRTPLQPLYHQEASGKSSLGTASREIRNIPSRNASLVSSILELQKATSRNKQKINNILNHNNNLNNIIYSNRNPHSDSVDFAFGDNESSIDLKDFYFNTWGSRDLGLDSKLEPEKVPRVIAPKRPIISSRVASKTRERHLKTETDFRSSRNGLVRIVKPFKPLPPIAQTQLSYHDENYDPDQVKREKTYVTLNRVDQILNPQKAFVTSELNSSELGILGSGSTTPDSQKRNKREKNDTKRLSYVENHLGNKNYHQTRIPNKYGGVTIVHTFRNSNAAPKSKTRMKPATQSVKEESRSLSPVLKCLDTDKVSSYDKCSKWVDDCSEYYD